MKNFHLFMSLILLNHCFRLNGLEKETSVQKETYFNDKLETDDVNRNNRDISYDYNPLFKSRVSASDQSDKNEYINRYVFQQTGGQDNASTNINLDEKIGRSAQRGGLQPFVVVEEVPRPQQGLIAYRPTTTPTTTQKPTTTEPVVQRGSLACYTCRLDFRGTDYNASHPCLRKGKNSIDPEFLVWCGPTDVFCRVERVELNGILIQLARECIDVCYYGCRPKGVGVTTVTCAECCDHHGCNTMYPASLANMNFKYELLLFYHLLSIVIAIIV